MASPAFRSVAALMREVLGKRHRFGDVALLENIGALLEHPRDSQVQGDVALPCFRLSKAFGAPPPKVAKLLHGSLSDEEQVAALQNAGVARTAASGPYLNFFLDRAALAQQVIPLMLKDEVAFFGARPVTSKLDKVMVEYSQPNTHKAFHVGHLRNASLGDAVGRLLEWAGHEVVFVNYIGDEGAHVAKCLWFLETHVREKGLAVPAEHRGEFLGKCYSKGTEMMNLDSLTQAPVVGVKAALVKEARVHPTNDAWQVCQVQDSECGELKTVVTGAKGFRAGDVVAYAPVGTRLQKKTLAPVDKGGVTSEGMLLSQKELGLIKEENQQIAVIPQERMERGRHALGAEVAEVYRWPAETERDLNEHPYALSRAEAPSVLAVFQDRRERASKILQSIEAANGNETYEEWRETKEWSMEEFKRIYKWIDARFDDWFFESEYGESSKALVREHQAKGVFKVSEGAVGADLANIYQCTDANAPYYVETEKKAKALNKKNRNLGFCLLIKSDGTALYATRDLALAQKKFEKYGVDKSLYVVDDAQTLHFQQVFKCLELMGYEQAAKCQHLAYAQVVLPDGKMSSRKGNVILFSELEAALVARIRADYLDKFRDSPDWSAAQLDDAAHKIALSAMRYGMLNCDPGSQIVFDLDGWCSVTGNTGPYLLYAYARARSILRQCEPLPGGSPVSAEDVDFALLNHELEADLIACLANWEPTMTTAASTLAPNQVCGYAHSLAKKFNKWFSAKECSAKGADTDDLKRARYVLVDAVSRCLKGTLKLVGIQVLERM